MCLDQSRSLCSRAGHQIHLQGNGVTKPRRQGKLTALRRTIWRYAPAAA